MTADSIRGRKVGQLVDPSVEPAADPSLVVDLGPLRLANPVMPASGCFGPELAAVTDVSRLGAVVTKTVFADARGGNPAHRLAESDDGMLNSVGIPTVGIGEFCRLVLPRYLALGPPVVVSIGGMTVEEYWRVAEELAGCGHAALELNVSCPNLETGGLEIGTDPTAVARATRGVVTRSGVPTLVKLTPNVADIAGLARAAADSGAVALTIANTIVGLAIDIRSRRALLGKATGGLSGRAMKPVALGLVHRASRVTDIPIVGCGGAASAEDVVEYMLAGASAVQIGTATFADPRAMQRVIDNLPILLAELGVAAASELIGAMQSEESR